MQRPLGAQISHMLKDRGVTHIFGIPGVHNQEMYRGIEEAGLVHVLARHEQGAGFMADGYARATGRPGVAYVITGPGLCNIMTPMGQAYSDSVPLLVISSCLDETATSHGQLHQMKDQRAAAETVCDWSEEARSAEAAYALVDRALDEFKSSRARSKHIQVPISLLEARAKPAPLSCHYDRYRSGFVGTSPNEQMLADLNFMFVGAKKPLFILGGGCVGVDIDYETFAKGQGFGLNPNGALRTYLKRTGSASFSTYSGRGLIGDDDPLHFGATLARPESADIFKQSDLIVAVGTSLAEVDFWRKTLRDECEGIPKIRVDVDATQFGDDFGVAKHSIVCRSEWFFRALLKHSDAIMDPTHDWHNGFTSSDWTRGDVLKYREKWRAEIDAERPGILPVADALRDCLPKGTMIYSDMTQFAYAAKEVWDMDRPGYWHHPTGFGTLGYATPAAIGGAVARPGLPTMAIIGDYGLQYTVQELATAVELKLPLPIFLWDNGKLGEIEDSMVRAQIAPNAVVQQNPDFLKLAEAYGAYSEGPKNLTEMQRSVQNAFKADRPTLIRVTPNIAM